MVANKIIDILCEKAFTGEYYFSYAPFVKDNHILKCRTGLLACILFQNSLKNPYHIGAPTEAGALF